MSRTARAEVLGRERTFRPLSKGERKALKKIDREIRSLSSLYNAEDSGSSYSHGIWVEISELRLRKERILEREYKK